MMLPQLISLRSEYETMKGMEQDLKTKLKNTQKSIKGKKNKDRVQLKKEHKAIKENRKTLYEHIQSQIPKTWNERSGPVGCIGVINAFVTGLKRRGGLRRGFDYYTQSLAYPMYIRFR